MRIEVIYCPACRHKLRIPEDLLGTEVQCPECKGTFVAPPPAPSEAPPMVVPAPGAMREGAPPRGADYGYEPRDDFESRPARPADPRGKIMAPAIALIVMALIHMAIKSFDLLTALTRPDELRQQMKQFQAMLPGAGPAPFDPVQVTQISASVFLVVSSLVLIGGFAMLTRRSYVLAIIGAGLSLIQCDPCCLISLPVGIWALIVLMMADVKASFPR